MMTFQDNHIAIKSCRHYKCSVPRKPLLVYILLASLSILTIVNAWKECLPEEGGGICPVGNTCCPTEIPGLSSCIPGRERDPEGARGQCCDAEGWTGCPYGYDCAIISPKTDEPQKMCKRQEPHPDSFNARETPRYQLCRLPPSSSPNTYDLQKFPIRGFNAVYYSSMGSILPAENTGHGMQKFASVETVVVIVHGSGRNADDYLCAGISTVSSISTETETPNVNSTNGSDKDDINQDKVLVIAPKFVADIDHDDRNRYDNMLYWLERGSNVPLGHTWRYGADAANSHGSTTLTSLSGSGHSHPENHLKDDDRDDMHKANKNGISSYAIMDSLLEFLIGSKHGQTISKSLRNQPMQEKEGFHFPNLQRIVVAGHSAGGQYVHRWSLLSSSLVIWGDGNNCVHDQNHALEKKTTSKDRDIELRMVVANPRSYCYPDKRRMIRAEKDPTSKVDCLGSNSIVTDTHDKNKKETPFISNNDATINEASKYRYGVPDPRDIDTCPTYDQWQWGLEPGGDILCPYKDAALALLNHNTTELILRYSKRKVFYLAGEHDTVELDDRCETYNFQGDNRNERARRYFRALSEYLTTLGGDRPFSSRFDVSTDSKSTNMIHEFHQVHGSPHDHTLMFQSAPGREAFYGNGKENSGSDDSRYYYDESLEESSNLNFVVDNGPEEISNIKL